MKELKSIQKSIRMTPTVLKYIDQQDGDGFNEKFENIVLYCMEIEKKLKEEEKDVKKRIEKLNDDINKKSSLLNRLTTIGNYIESAYKCCNT